jgi:hypothetical protein
MRLTYPAIRIHIWGGLGSQLFGWAVLLDLQRKFPRRRFIVIFHNGGVSQRDPELIGLLDACEFKFVNDFKLKNDVPALRKIWSRFSNSIGRFSRLLFRLLGFIARANSNAQFENLKPWLISLRGHYSNRLISKSVCDSIRGSLFADFLDFEAQQSKVTVGVHFRLGDLVNLQTKKPLDPQRIVDGLNSALPRIYFHSEVLVCSDSPTLAIDKISALMPASRFNPSMLPPRETIYLLSNVEIFLGSPSKISEWVALFRVHSSPSCPTWLPVEMQTQIQIISGLSRQIHFY